MNHLHSRKIALVTGGTDGIGKEIARGLAAQGMRVGIVGRSLDKGSRAEQELRASTQNPRVEFFQADLSLMAECRRLAENIQGNYQTLNYLVHSAGILRSRRELTAERIESNFATNYLSRYALTQRLIPLLSATGVAGDAARVVIISGAARHGKIHFDDVSLYANFSMLRAILQYCQANDLYAVELARRLRTTGQPPSVTVVCLKIGVVKTGIRRGFPRWMRVLVPLVFDPLLGQTPQEAAKAALGLLLPREDEGATGGLFVKIRRLKQVALTANELANEQCQRLWDLSERLAFPELASEISPSMLHESAPSSVLGVACRP